MIVTTIPIPAAGVYPTGSPGVSRGWDGHAWALDSHLDPHAPALPAWQRRPLAVLGHPLFWLWFGTWIVGIALAGVAVSNQSWALLWASAVIGTTGPLLALTLFIRSRLVLGQAISTKAFIGWGLVSGVVAFAWALAVDAVWDSLVNAGSDSWQSQIMAGPAEESGKILVVVILYVFGRYRDPRAGVALALFSGMVFGWLEGIEYALVDEQPSSAAAIHHAQAVAQTFSEPALVQVTAIARPFVEMFHPLTAVFIAAVAWRWGWVRHRFWPALFAAWLVAAAVHSLNDLSPITDWLGDSAFINGLPTLVGGVVLFLQILVLAALTYVILTRPTARESAPPNALAVNPPKWRPRIPKHEESTGTAQT